MLRIIVRLEISRLVDFLFSFVVRFIDVLLLQVVGEAGGENFEFGIN